MHGSEAERERQRAEEQHDRERKRQEELSEAENLLARRAEVVGMLNSVENTFQRVDVGYQLDELFMAHKVESGLRERPHHRRIAAATTVCTEDDEDGADQGDTSIATLSFRGRDRAADLFDELVEDYCTVAEDPYEDMGVEPLLRFADFRGYIDSAGHGEYFEDFVTENWEAWRCLMDFLVDGFDKNEGGINKQGFVQLRNTMEHRRPLAQELRRLGRPMAPKYLRTWNQAKKIVERTCREAGREDVDVIYLDEVRQLMVEIGEPTTHEQIYSEFLRCWKFRQVLNEFSNRYFKKHFLSSPQRFIQRARKLQASKSDEGGGADDDESKEDLDLSQFHETEEAAAEAERQKQKRDASRLVLKDYTSIHVAELLAWLHSGRVKRPAPPFYRWMLRNRLHATRLLQGASSFMGTVQHVFSDMVERGLVRADVVEALKAQHVTQAEMRLDVGDPSLLGEGMSIAISSSAVPNLAAALSQARLPSNAGAAIAVDFLVRSSASIGWMQRTEHLLKQCLMEHFGSALKSSGNFLGMYVFRMESAEEGIPVIRAALTWNENVNIDLTLRKLLLPLRLSDILAELTAELNINIIPTDVTESTLLALSTKVAVSGLLRLSVGARVLSYFVDQAIQYVRDIKRESDLLRHVHECVRGEAHSRTIQTLKQSKYTFPARFDPVLDPDIPCGAFRPSGVLLERHAARMRRGVRTNVIGGRDMSEEITKLEKEAEAQLEARRRQRGRGGRRGSQMRQKSGKQNGNTEDDHPEKRKEKITSDEAERLINRAYRALEEASSRRTQWLSEEERHLTRDEDRTHWTLANRVASLLRGFQAGTYHLRFESLAQVWAALSRRFSWFRNVASVESLGIPGFFASLHQRWSDRLLRMFRQVLRRVSVHQDAIAAAERAAFMERMTSSEKMRNHQDFLKQKKDMAERLRGMGVEVEDEALDEEEELHSPEDVANKAYRDQCESEGVLLNTAEACWHTILGIHGISMTWGQTQLSVACSGVDFMDCFPEPPSVVSPEERPPDKPAEPAEEPPLETS